MAFSKAPLFDKPHFEQSFWSKALAHPARIIILTHLLEYGITPFYDFKKLIPLAPTTISQHLRQLRQAHLIKAYEK
ncbi:MAG TPA: ArsR family transcriptional regulator, partial [Saprospiraceae bacterium]|nr:ArsR family transcriptional regulator [Saprospiraceae bacterium]